MLISNSHFVRNGRNKSILGSFGDGPRHIRCDVEGDTGVIGVDGDIGTLSEESSLAAAAWVRVMVSLSVPPPVAASVRIASLFVGAVFSSYEMVIC